MALASFHNRLHRTGTQFQQSTGDLSPFPVSFPVRVQVVRKPDLSPFPVPFPALKLLLLLFVCWSFVLTSQLQAEETPVERAAAALLKTTVTVRILPARTTKPTASSPTISKSAGEPSTQSPKTASATTADEPTGVLVSSGVSLGSGLVLTFSQLPALNVEVATPANQQASATHRTTGPEYRVTLPDGEQAQAQAVVIDQYSGLVLLEIKQRTLPGLQLATELPGIGGNVFSASAAGIDRPLVTLGILSGVERTVPGASLPPMLQSDISTTEASSGAALIDCNQKLIGIIAATDASSQNVGWSFAIPYPHIRRVLAARISGKLVVLARQRAVVGLKLGPGPQEGTVQVEHVVPGGPAEKAGVRQGEMVLEAEGRKLRSAYQAVALILKRMPGDEMTFVVGTEKTPRTVKVKLGGGAAARVPEVPGEEGRYRVGAQVEVQLLGPNRYEVRNGQRVKELNVSVPAANDAKRVPPTESELLLRQLQAYQDLIVVLQKERLDRQNQQQAQTEVLKSLREEIGALKQKLAEERAGK